jgi:hypothetical protein
MPEGLTKLWGLFRTRARTWLLAKVLLLVVGFGLLTAVATSTVVFKTPRLVIEKSSMTSKITRVY